MLTLVNLNRRWF